MGAFFHILLCSAAAIGGYLAVGLTSQPPMNAAGEAVASYRFIEPGLMAVPIVHGSRMKGLAFLQLGLTVDATLPFDDATLGVLVADGLYDAVIPEPSQADSENALDKGFLDLRAVRAAITDRLNEVAGVAVVKDVMVLQLDMRGSDDLRSPTLDAVIDR